MTARLLLLAAAALFSTGGAAVKGTFLNAWQVAGARSLIAAVVILALLPEARRPWRWSYVPVACAYAATMLLFVSATKLTTAGNAIFLQSAAPFFVVLLSPVLLREPVRRSDLAVLLAIAGGMALCFAPNDSAQHTAPDPIRGNLLAAASALTWALTLVGLRSLGRHAPRNSGAALATVSIGNLIVGVVALPFALPLPLPAWHDTAVLLWLGVFQVALAYVCLTRGLRSVPAVEATLLMMLEPALNPVWAWAIHGETPGRNAIAGGALIMAAVVARTWWQNRR